MTWMADTERRSCVQVEGWAIGTDETNGGGCDKRHAEQVYSTNQIAPRHCRVSSALSASLLGSNMLRRDRGSGSTMYTISTRNFVAGA
eukprot:1234905-Rhodomonas_salina.1